MCPSFWFEQLQDIEDLYGNSLLVLLVLVDDEVCKMTNTIPTQYFFWEILLIKCWR